MYPGADDISCTEADTEHFMREVVDDISHSRAMLEIEVDTYLEVHGNAPP